MENVINIKVIALSVLFLEHIELSDLDFCSEIYDQNTKSVQSRSDSDSVLPSTTDPLWSVINRQFCMLL